MQTQYVLRIEHPETKKGPFFHSPVSYGALPAQPTPAGAIWMDVLPQQEFTNEHVCGAEYMSHIYEWLGHNLDYLTELGFKLYMYLLPESKVLRTYSSKQVAFNPADALEVQEVG